jgi:hypothetical protein
MISFVAVIAVQLDVGNTVHLLLPSIFTVFQTYFCAGMILITAAVRKPNVPYDHGTA